MADKELAQTIANWMQKNDPNGEWDNIFEDMSIEEAFPIMHETLKRWFADSGYTNQLAFWFSRQVIIHDN